jgi:lysophospholipase L1-like esterase
VSRLLLGLVLVVVGGCSRFDPAASRGAPDVDALRYVALGDSYTIGTSVAPADRWPNLLVDRLGSGAPSLRLVDNLAVNGFTSADVIERELPHLDELRPEFVSLLVGVNDALLARVPADRIVVVSTPDYTVTPEGASFGDPAIQSAGIVRNNVILAALADARGIAFVDVYDLSLRAADDPSLTADDGLHPSGAQYVLWVERVAPVVAALLGRPDATAD